MAWISPQQQDRDRQGLRNTCAACGHEGSLQNPLVVADDGFRIHQSHTTDPNDGYFGRQQRG